MNSYRKNTMNRVSLSRGRGFTLLDVLLAIVIFVIGMLALAHLQTNLTRSATDGNARTMATNIGEEVIERLRSFERVYTDPDGVDFAYADIVDDYIDNLYGTETRGGLNFTVSGVVRGYDFDEDRVSLVDAEGVEAAAGEIYDFKRVDLTISWDAAGDFQVNEGVTVSSEDLGSGRITLAGIIPSTSNKAQAQIAAEDEDAGSVPVEYNPGANPDIIQLDLADDRFKEATTPIPDVIRERELVETWFDVITYNQDTSATFLRREEFLVVGCLCELAAPDGDETTGFLPTVWNGNEYETLGGEDAQGRALMVSKRYGISASNQQSAYCTTCCRDHHDMQGASGNQLFDPDREWTATGEGGDHEHYARAVPMELADVGDEYAESCRMIRKDGFMRVAQDFRQEGFVAFPEGYLETLDNATEYADYVEAAVRDFYEAGGGDLQTPTDLSFDFPADDDPDGDRTILPYNGNDLFVTQQMRSRGIYIDRVQGGSELAEILDCMINDYPDGTENLGDLCGAPGAKDWLEVLPFFDVQTTWLSWWIENSSGDPMDITNQAVTDDNQHSRGVAELTNAAAEPTLVTVTTDMHRGNVGLAVIDAISPLDNALAAKAKYDLFVDVNGADGDPPNPVGNYWSGTLRSAVGGVNASGAILTPDANTHCSRTSTALTCTTAFGVGTGTLTVSGYYKNAGTNLWVCAPGFESFFTIDNQPDGTNKSATLSWANSSNRQGITLVIDNQECATP